MKMSIRHFLLLNLLFAEILISVVAVSVILFVGHRNIAKDDNSILIASAFILQDFIGDVETPEKIKQLQNDIAKLSQVFFHTSEYLGPSYKALHFRIWDRDGTVILESSDLIPCYFNNPSLGFSEITYGDQKWRAFTSIDPDNKNKIMVIQQGLDSILPGHIAREIIFVMMFSYPFLGLLMWIIVSRGLKALRNIFQQVQQQAPENLLPLDTSNLPKEIKPMAEEWNKLFDRLKLAFDREKRFAADAAHELKTPLAALKTHTQLALNAKSENERINALNKVIVGVNRSAHVLQQLLTLNRMSHGVIMEKSEPINIVQQAREVITEVIMQALEKDSDIELISLPTPEPMIQGYTTAINILIRNLLDNAIRYSPEKSLVQVFVEETVDKKQVILKVVDNGPGVPKHLHQRVFERFFRIIGNKSPGSGLGLGIVQQIAELHNASILLEEPVDHQGLQVTVIFPARVNEVGDNNS